MLVRASRDALEHYPTTRCSSKFEASWGLIVTWHNVTFFGAAVAPYPVKPDSTSPVTSPHDMLSRPCSLAKQKTRDVTLRDVSRVSMQLGTARTS